MRINPIFVPIIVIVMLLGSVVAAQGAGQWSTSGKTAVNLEQFSAADIKGWMAIQQVIDGTGIPKDRLYELASFPADTPATTALKDLEGVIPDFEISTLREKLATSQQDSSQESAPSATPLPVPTATPVPTQAAPLVTPVHGTPTPLPVGEVLPGGEVKGRMSLKEVSDQCEVSLPELLATLGLPPETDPGTVLKDLVSQGKLPDMTTAQAAVTALQSK